MYYSLTSSRDLGSFTQVVTSFQKHTPASTAVSSESSLIALHKVWRTRLATLDGDSWETGSLNWSGLVELDDGKTDNDVYSNNKGDITVTISTEVSSTVKSVSFKAKDVQPSTLATTIRDKYVALTGRDLDNSAVKNNTFITNVIINLHE